MSSHPGLLALTPPRQCARGREKDTLLLLLTLSGTPTATASIHIRLLERAARAFYETPGSLTFALRTAAETLNEELLERNLKASGQGAYLVGSLILGALRNTQIYLLQSGNACVLQFGRGGVQRFFDPQFGGRGLGTAQSAKYYLTKLTLQKRDRLLFCGDLPPEWNEPPQTLRVPTSPEEGYRKLMDSAEGDISAALAFVEIPGNGVLRVESPPQMKAPSPLSAYAIPPEKPLPSNETTPPTEKIAEAESGSMSESEPPPQDRTPRSRRAARTALSFLLFWKNLRQRFQSGIQRILPRFLPLEKDEVFALPAWTMILVAIAIPLFVGTAASVVYFHYGPNLQYETYLTQAQIARTRAEEQTDPLASRSAWEETLFYVEKAEAQRETAETKALREEARTHLDELLGIQRIMLRPALTPFPADVSISRMAANDTDLYLLNAADGSILRASLVNGSYQWDENFLCKPGIYEDNQISVGPMVSLLVLPRINAIGATVMGIDSSGNLLYCAPNQIPKAMTLIPPDTQWNAITAMDFGDAGALYILDASQRAVWVYQGKASAFLDSPAFFFRNEIPPLEDAIDLAANGDDVYILHQDGHLTQCTYSRLQDVPTRCTDPAPMSDSHPAAQDSDVFSQTHFTQMLISTPPDSALLILDSQAQTIFWLGVRSLSLQTRIRPPLGDKNPLGDKPITAMTVAPNRWIFLASGNRVYFSMDTP